MEPFELSPLMVVVLLLALALGGVTVLKIFRLPTLPAYFLTGYITGPYGLGVLNSGEQADFVAELGVICLLFTIGLEFSLRSLSAMRRYVFILGALQVFLSMAFFGGVAWYFLQDGMLAFLVGAVAAMSSTAIVSQLLIQENAVTSPAGRRAIAVLLFQDLAIIPIIIVVSAADTAVPDVFSMVQLVGLVILKIAVVLGIVLLAGKTAMSGWLNWVSRRGDKELFMLSLLAIIIMSAGLTALFDLSYALGAFLAGMVISDTWHRHRVERIVDPFRRLFLGFFFVSLGLLINPTVLLEKWSLVLLAAGFLVFFKIPLVAACVWLVGSYSGTVWRTAILLGGAGEFGFLLLTVARGGGVLEDDIFQWLLAANLLALLATPLLWPFQEKLVNFLAPDAPLHAEQKNTNPSLVDGMGEHFIICGFGRTGQAIAGILRALQVPYIAVEDDYQILRAVGGTDNVIYGESDRIDSITKTGIAQARALIVTFMEAPRVISTVQLVRSINPDIYILVKAASVSQAEIFSEAGADDALVESHESGFSLASIAARKIFARQPYLLNAAIHRARFRENRFFSGDFGQDDDYDSESTHFIGCRVLNVDCVGKELTAAVLEDVLVIAWRREGKNLDADRNDLVLELNDDLVLQGAGVALGGVKAYLEKEE